MNNYFVEVIKIERSRTQKNGNSVQSLFMAVLAFGLSILLTGCEPQQVRPDELAKKGQYEEASKMYVDNAKNDEAVLKDINESGDQRIDQGRLAIENYYKAAECQEKRGNTEQAKVLYQHVLELYDFELKTFKGVQNGGWQTVTLKKEIDTYYLDMATAKLKKLDPEKSEAKTPDTVKAETKKEF